MAFVEHDNAIEVRSHPIDDLLDPRSSSLACIGSQRGVGGEEDALFQADRRALPEAGERRDEKTLLSERRPVTLRVLDQLVRLTDPDCTASALQPVVEDDAGDLAALPGPSTVAQHPAAAETLGIVRIVRCGRDRIVGFADRPRSREMRSMGLAGIDDALELRIRKKTVGDDIGRKMWTIARLRWRDGRHGRRLNQSGRMRLTMRDSDRLKGVGLVEHLADPAAVRWPPVDRVIPNLDGITRDECEPSGRR